MKNTKLVRICAFAAVLLLCLAASSCSNAAMGPQGAAGPSDLRNTAWSRQMGSSTARLAFDVEGVYVSGTGTPWDGWCGYGGYGYGCCGFRNNYGSNLSFNYTLSETALMIRNCNNPSFNGQWARTGR